MSLTKVSYSMINGAPVNALDFGAIGDGVTDNSVAIQAAVDAISGSESGILVIPAGTFYIASTVNLTSNITIVGAGKGLTVLKGALRTAPNTHQVSSNIFTGTSVSNVVLKGITFDGSARPVFYAGDLPAKALVDFETSTNITVEDCDFKGFIYSLVGTETAGESSYKLGALFAYASSYITVKNVEYVAPTYGNLLMFIECTNIMVDGAKSTFATSPTASTNETPLNIWGDDCQYVTIQNCEFAQCVGSAINLGGKGSFLIKSNRIYNIQSGVGGGIDLSNENWVSATPPDMYNVIIDGNTFTDVQSTVQVGDVRSGENITTHEIVISNNAYQMSVGGTFGNFLIGNSDFAVISNNSFNGASIQLNYNNICSVEGNTMYGRQQTGETGISVFCRASTTKSYSYIRKNILSDFGNGVLTVYGFYAAPYTNIVYTDNDMLYTGSYVPANGQYIIVVPAGGNMAYIPGDFTISTNRLNGASYIPFSGTDTAIYATNFYTGSLTTKVGGFTRDTTLATGTQAITGVGFRPRSVIFFMAQPGTGEASFGFSDNNLTQTSGENYCVNSRTATSAGTFYSNSAAIFSYESSGDYYSGSIDTLDSDGFTINWTKTGSPSGTIEIAYLALA